MTEIQLKTRIGLSIVISHFSILLLVVVLFLFGGFIFEEMTTTIALIIPMFGIYTSAIIKHIIANRKILQTDSEMVTKDYIFISFMIPSIFIIFIISIVILKAFNIGFTSFEQFKTMLAIGETMFGAYFGIVLSSMFNINTEVEKANNKK